ncbi:rab-GTPase-TBC domain-containing protein [Kockovaella imperatae]|uniref:Rab-GTPase-TBC domain-containing protein n=1 Tax=Kockovaella imperatae TaxID=4999 RepID=A0A1Y1US18_9TREE|nr:rab-GTPase-TBC domain-containing protein [Kockovaella imperatae]ORX40833.1 rab-GTPase-TBC domain-containing protein [Kockovaella imperatae]
MTAQRSNKNTVRRTSSASDDSLPSILDYSTASLTQVPHSPLSDFEHLSQPSSMSSSSSDRPKAKLLYCKSHIAIHPTQFNKDNVSGYLGIVETRGHAVQTDSEGGVRSPSTTSTELLVTWVPDELLNKMDKEDREGYKRVDARISEEATENEKYDEDFVFVSVPPARGEKYAFSVPLSGIYSILVYPPSLSHWYGSATLNLAGGISLPTLFFHDDESPMLASTSYTKTNPSRPIGRPQWGFPSFLHLLQTRATLLKSRLVSGHANHNAELWLINPSKSDREVHEAGVSSDALPSRHAEGKIPEQAYPPPKGGFPDAKAVIGNDTTPKQALLSGLSQITRFSRKTANQITQQVLSHPLAQEVVPRLPPAVRSLVNAHGEWERSGRLPPKNGKNDVVTEFESARLYLARWARVVAEEGERSRREEVAGKAGLGKDDSAVDDLTSSLGVFSILSSPNSKRPVPHSTRRPHHPITSHDWDTFAAQGRDELWIRREIFQRGFTDSPEPDQKRARREGWEVLLGIVPWSLGGLGGLEADRQKRQEARQKKREDNRAEYERLKSKWQKETAEQETEEWKEEWHRIDVDCRRTDRTQPIFAIPAEAMAKGQSEIEEVGPSSAFDDTIESDGRQALLNPHVAALRTILMTYHSYHPDLGYVQGMSDLLSPIYVVLEANEADAFWGLVGVMKMMETNFLRDQSGMRMQLSTLQQLIGVMDPELYSHLERTGSLNLFFCYRWVLIAFKREFKFEDVIRLWDVLWTDFYSTHFVLFIALAILQSHRDVILRYLTEFDEVLKYANNLSGTIELDSTLAQAEVLFLSFKNLVEELDKGIAEAEGEAGDSGSSVDLRKRANASSVAGVQEQSDEDKERLANIERDKQILTPQLRDLLDSWKEDGKRL